MSSVIGPKVVKTKDHANQIFGSTEVMPEQLPLWAEQTNCAITVCDCDGIIIYMNERARETFASHGPLIGKNLFDCHKPESARMIRHMLATARAMPTRLRKTGSTK